MLSFKPDTTCSVAPSHPETRAIVLGVLQDGHVGSGRLYLANSASSLATITLVRAAWSFRAFSIVALTYAFATSAARAREPAVTTTWTTSEVFAAGTLTMFCTESTLVP